VEDPLRLAGVRDYRRVIPCGTFTGKSSARTGTQTKVFEPAASQHLAIFLNGQTARTRPTRRVGDYFETAIMVAPRWPMPAWKLAPGRAVYQQQRAEASRRVRSRPAARLADVRILETWPS